MQESEKSRTLLDRAASVFALAGKLGKAFHEAHREQGNRIELDCWNQLAPLFAQFYDELSRFDDSDLTDSPSSVATSLLEAARIAEAIRTSLDELGKREFAEYLDFFPNLNTVAVEGARALKEARDSAPTPKTGTLFRQDRGQNPSNRPAAGNLAIRAGDGGSLGDGGAVHIRGGDGGLGSDGGSVKIIAGTSYPQIDAHPPEIAHVDQRVISTEDRRFMELAIEEARKSVGEDGRAHPKVGAVVVKDGAVLATAFRGELGKGEHAEYTVLEKKLKDDTLVGATVYATLEPCTTLNDPKTACARRLIDRRVKRVVIGMLDPNPRICGRGERMLRDHGIEVEHFPHDLVMKLEEMNRAFVNEQSKTDAAPPNPPLQSRADPVTGLRDLHRRVVSAQDQFPREVSFALVMIPHDERQAWKEAKKWFDDMASGPPKKDGWRCLAVASGGDTPETITIPASESTGGTNCPVIYNCDSWRCWILRQSTTAPYPSNALNMFHSLAADACRLLDLRDCGQIIDGQRVGRERGKYQHLLRWCVEQLPAEECEKLTWLDPPNEYVRTTLQADRTPRRWLVEMPCVFATVAHALARHTGGLGKPWPSA